MFIKKVTKGLLETHKCFLIAEKTKLKQIAKEHKKMDEAEQEFYYLQMHQITKALNECTKQLELLEQGETNAKSKNEE